MSEFKFTRRGLLGSAVGLAAYGMAPDLLAATPALPKSPVALNVVDVAGNLALTQKAIETYRNNNPKLVSRVTFTKAPSPELPGKIKAQQAANRVDIDIVLTGIDALSAGVEQKLWQPMLPDFSDKLPKLDDIYLSGAKQMQALAANQGVCVVFCQAGPLLEYMPDRVKTVPKTAADLLAWAKANPNRFMYARPANSGPGRVFMMGLPYVLGDKDPKDPKNGWDKTWAYLKELGQHIEYYPSGTGPTMKALGDGSRDMIPTQMGWDINPRALGVVPKEAKVAALDGFHWILDAHYLCVPKGVSADKQAVIVDLLAYLLSKPAKARR
jgi:putative spermidine/putrescine transport system substrate-binding protein